MFSFPTPKKRGDKQKDVLGFEPRTCALWMQHASTGPLGSRCAASVTAPNSIAHAALETGPTLCQLGAALSSDKRQAVVAEWLRRLTRNQFPSGSVGSSPTGCVDFCPNRTWVGQSRQRHRVAAAAAAAAARGSDECEIKTVKQKREKNCPRRGSNSQPRHRSQPLPYKYRALTDCATGALRSNVLHSVLCSST